MRNESIQKTNTGRVHPPSRFDSGDGQGTSRGAKRGTRALEHPILDGATESDEIEHEAENPWRGLTDPALKRHPERRRSGDREHAKGT